MVINCFGTHLGPSLFRFERILLPSPRGGGGIAQSKIGSTTGGLRARRGGGPPPRAPRIPPKVPPSPPQVRQMRCAHFYHVGCIDRWFTGAAPGPSPWVPTTWHRSRCHRREWPGSPRPPLKRTLRYTAYTPPNPTERSPHSRGARPPPRARSARRTTAPCPPPKTPRGPRSPPPPPRAPPRVTNGIPPHLAHHRGLGARSQPFHFRSISYLNVCDNASQSLWPQTSTPPFPPFRPRGTAVVPAVRPAPRAPGVTTTSTPSSNPPPTPPTP